MKLSRIPYKYGVLVVVVVGSFMVMLDTTVVNVALPSIMNDFNASLDRAQLVVTMYLVALALIIPTTGYFTDRLGAKRLYTLSIAGFTLGSVLCGLAWDINSLIFFRIIQGLAGGITMPLGIALIFRTVPREEQGAIVSLTGLPIFVAPILGPIVSGYLVEAASWRWIFFVNVPLGIMGITLAGLLLRETERLQTLSFDYKGFILAGAGFSTALIALTQVPDDGWGAANVLGLLSVSAAALAAWIAVELSVDSPLLDLRIFRNFMYTKAATVFFISSTILFLALFLLPLFLQNVRGLSAKDTGFLIMPEGVGFALILPIAGRLYDRFGPRPLMIPGLLIVSYTMFQLHNIDLSTSDGTLVKLLLLQGAGLGLMSTPAFILTYSLFSPAQLVRATALTNVLRQLFPAFGAAIFAAMLQTRQAFHFSTLSQTVTPDSLTAVQVLSRLENLAAKAGASDVLANQTAVQVLNGIVESQAATNAFNDVFLVASIFVLVALLPALFLSKPEQIEAQAAPASAPATETDD